MAEVEQKQSAALDEGGNNEDPNLKKRRKKKKRDEQKLELTPSEELAAQLEEETRQYLSLPRAAYVGDLQLVEFHLKDGAKPDTPCPDTGLTPVVAAVQGNHIAVVKSLVSLGKADVNKPSLQGTTPLMQACLLGDSVDLVQYFVEERGANVHAQDNAGSTALFYAARSGNLRAAEILLQRGAKVNHANKGDVTAMMIAAATGHIPIIELLHRNDANSQLADLSGNTALHHAAMCGQAKAASCLVALYPGRLGVQNLDKKTPTDVAANKLTEAALLSSGQ